MTFRVLVLADTHIPGRAATLPGIVLDELTRADAVIHLGDFTDLPTVRTLQAYAPLHAVHGNNDSAEIQSHFPERARILIDGRSLLLMHGHTGGRTALAAAQTAESADAVLFGHSHRAFSEWVDGRLLFNPGSATDRRWGPYRSFGLLRIGATIDAEIVPI